MPLANELAWSGADPTHDEALEVEPLPAGRTVRVVECPKFSMTAPVRPVELRHLLPRFWPTA